MIRAPKENLIFTYADDTAVVVADENVENDISVMQDQLKTAAKWCHDNGLVINATKTKIMNIKSPHFSNCNILVKFHNNECLQ